MWIRKKGNQAVNTDLIQTIWLYSNSETHYIQFQPIRSQSNEITYGFKVKEERDAYYEKLMEKLNAVDIENEADKLKKMLE